MGHLLVSGLLLGVSIAAPLGPVSIQQIRQGLTGGFWPAFSVSLGAVTGDTLYFSLVAFGLAPIIFRYPVIKTILWLAGTFFLIRLGVSSLRKVQLMELDAAVTVAGDKKLAYLTGLYLCLTNPMGFVLWSSVGTAVFASAGLSLREGYQGQLLLLYLGVIAGILGWGCGFSLFLSWGRRFVNSKVLALINRICGMVLLGFAMYFFWQAARSLGHLGP